MKKLIILSTLCLMVTLQAVAQSGAISGKVLDDKKEPIIGAIVQVTQNGIKKGAAATDEDGNYTIKPLNPGKYDLKASYASYRPKVVISVIVASGKTTKVNVQLELDTKKLEAVEVVAYKVPLTSEDERKVITSEEVEKMPTRNTNSIASTSAGVYQAKEGKALNLGGARPAGNAYIIDGVRVYGKQGVVAVQRSADRAYAAPTPTYLNPSTESYKKNTENDFMTVKANPLSTLSVDVDRASYSNVRRFITDGQMPPRDAVRVEEMINYFDYQYPQPREEDPIAIVTELTDCPWQPQHQLLHIGMQARTISTKNLPASNLVFLIDVSGSMNEANKLPLVISSLKLLVNKLRAKDMLSIVVYAGNAGLVLPATPGNEKSTIYAALNKLQAGGSTAGGAGIKLAYKIAVDNYVEGGNNRVILATDGDFNVGVSGDNELEDLIVKERKKGVFLTCLGYGMGNYKDSKMEVLADKGNGNYNYIDNIMEAEKTLVNEFGGTLFTVAKDVKAQIEFNPAKVQGYRLVGYENRLLNEEDFKDDKKDAGDMGSGHTVTIIYEVIPTGVKSKLVRSTTPLKYQQRGYPSVLDIMDNEGELATIKFRYKQPDANKSKEMVHVIADNENNMQEASENARFATSVAMFGMLLKNSQYKGNTSYDNVLRLAKASKGEDENGYRAEFIQLVKTVNNKTGLASARNEEEE